MAVLLVLFGTSSFALAEKALVLYFSYTGNSKAIAEKIQAGIKNYEQVDLCRIETTEEYTKDIDELMPQAKKEANDKNFRPKLKKMSVDSAKYCAVIVVFPVWYGTAPKAVIAALEQMNLEGKKVCTVVTHGGGKGTSEEDVKAVCKGAHFGPCASIYCDYPANGKFNEGEIENFAKDFNGEK